MRYSGSYFLLQQRDRVMVSASKFFSENKSITVFTFGIFFVFSGVGDKKERKNTFYETYFTNSRVEHK